MVEKYGYLGVMMVVKWQIFLLPTIMGKSTQAE